MITNNSNNNYVFLNVFMFRIMSMTLTAHNWQKWKKKYSWHVPAIKIYRDEAVGLKNCSYTWKIIIFVKMWNLGQYLENLLFCQ